MADRHFIIEEHFWFTATTLAMNGFIISSKVIDFHITSAKIISLIVSAYAFYLIVHRAAAHAGKLESCYPESLKEVSSANKTFIHKAKETWCHLKIFPKQLLYSVCELGSSFFYLILVTVSCVAVLIVR